MPISKITKVKPFPPKGGKTTYGVTMEDGTSGYYTPEGEMTFAVGNQVEYTATQHEKKDKSGKYFSIDSLVLYVAPKAQKPVKHLILDVAMKDEVRKEKYRASIEAMRFVMDLVIGDKITFDKVKDSYKEVFTYLSDAVEDIATE